MEYLGLGTAAATMLGRASYERLCRAVPSLPAPSPSTERLRLTVTSGARDVAATSSLAGLAFDVEQLSARESACEDLMLAARMTDGISPELIACVRSLVGDGRVDDTVSGLLDKGLLAGGDGGRLVPTHLGWLLGNELYGPLWDLAHD